jgi:hypothetical protein
MSDDDTDDGGTAADRHRCECGRPALVLPRVRANSSGNARAGRPVALRGHPLCFQCHRRGEDARHGRGGRS